MKKIAILALLLLAFSLQACLSTDFSTTTLTTTSSESSTTTTSTFSELTTTTTIPTTQTVIESTTSTQTTTTPPLPEYQLHITSPGGQTFTIDEEVLKLHHPVEFEVLDEFGKIQVFVGYRISGLLRHTTYDGFTVANDLGSRIFRLHLTDIYLVVGEKQNNQLVSYSYHQYHISRVRDRQWTETIKNPDSIICHQTNPEKVLYYIEYRSVTGRYDHHTSLRAMQGIINREHPRLLTISTGNPYYKYSDHQWLYYLESIGYDLVELLSLEEVLYTFQSTFQGIITFRDRMKSYNNWVSAESDFALMMASVMNYAPIPFGLEQTMASLTGLEIIQDFQVNGKTVLGNISTYFDQLGINEAYKVYEHVFTQFKEAFNTKSYMSLTSEVMDYAASEKMMFFDLKATQSERDHLLSRQINQYFDQLNDFFNVYGWVDHESSALDFISSYGGIIDVVGNGNLSLLHRLPTDTTTFTQKAEPLSSYNTAKKYVTFFASESDTIKVGVAFQHGAWLDPNRGKVPINWGLIADMSQEFPFVYDYYMKTATPMDYFYSGGGSAIGFVDIDSQMSLISRNAIADANKIALQTANQSIIDLYNDKYTPTDLFEKSVLGSYLSRSGVGGAFGRIHDSNTSIRVETWNSVPVYNRWTNFYPRRGSSSEVSLTNLTILNAKHLIQSASSRYWFLETELANTQNTIGFELFRQSNGDGYKVVFSGGTISLIRRVAQTEETLQQMQYHTSTRKVKLSIDQATSIDLYPRIKLYVNDLKIFDYYDKDITFQQGGYGIYSDDAISSTFLTFTGTKWSMAQAIYNRIITDSNRFIVAYYGFVGTDEYGNAQYRTEPGVGGVISLSPTDFYKIKLMLDQNYPGVYEIVHANEFMQYAKQYQAYYGNLK